MILQGEDRTAQRQRGSMTKRRHVGRKEPANRRTEYPAGKPTDRQTDPAERRSGVGRLRKRDTSDAPERQKTIGIGCVAETLHKAQNDGRSTIGQCRFVPDRGQAAHIGQFPTAKDAI